MAGKVDLKVVLLGKEYGGKTSLVERYIHGKFNAQAPYQSTIGAAFGAKKVSVNGESVTLGIWDTAGSERYESMSRIYYRGAKSAIVCFDLTDPSSFERAKFWVNELKQTEEECVIYLCGTKYDLVEENKKARKIEISAAKEYADEISAKFIETSAKTGYNIDYLFMMIAEDYVTVTRDRLQSNKVTTKEEEKSVMEKAVTSLKERKQQKAIDLLVDPSSKDQQISEPKPPLLTRVKNVLIHYYHGFRLFGLEVKIAIRLFLKILRGHALSRREQKQFRRTVGDVFRIVPFSVFIIIPFMEFLLPVYLWLFPNALPSTFQTKSLKDARKQKELKVKIKMAKFLQDTIQEMSVTSNSPKNAEAVKKFATFFEKIRTTGAQATTEEIIAFSKLFEDELTLNNLSYRQLQALCRLVLLPTIGSGAFLRFQLRMKMKQLEADDRMIQKEGIESLTVPELQAASQARGMRALGMPVERLKSQLQQWLDLHLNKKISISFLLLSRALYLPPNIPTSDVLRATLYNLPENIVDEAEVLVASTAGETIDNRRKVSIIQQQETFIQEEEREKMERDRERLEKEIKKEGQVTFKNIDFGKQIVSSPTSQFSDEMSFSAEEIQQLSQAVSSLKRTLEEEKETLREIKEDREEFIEDIANLAHECAEGEEQLVESVASRRLGRKVETMISTIDETLADLEQQYIGSSQNELPGNLISVEHLEKALLALRGTSCEAKHRSLFSVLDDDHDGNIKLEEVAEVIEALANENTDINKEDVHHIKYLITNKND